MPIKIKNIENELKRLNEMNIYENALYNKGFFKIAGIDEAGRGPLMGPVVAAAVILPKDLLILGVNDSKKVSEKNRELLYDEILESAISWGVGIVEPERIDEINILNATKEAMFQAINNLSEKPDHLLIDAVKLNYPGIEYTPLIKGDSLSHSIAAASIIAKVTRDRIVKQYSIQYPEYKFEKNKGYGTAEHISALKEFGVLPIHRRSFIKNFV